MRFGLAKLKAAAASEVLASGSFLLWLCFLVLLRDFLLRKLPHASPALVYAECIRLSSGLLAHERRYWVRVGQSVDLWWLNLQTSADHADVIPGAAPPYPRVVEG